MRAGVTTTLAQSQAEARAQTQELRDRHEQVSQTKLVWEQAQAGAQNHPSSQTVTSRSLSNTNLSAGACRRGYCTGTHTGKSGVQGSRVEAYQNSPGAAAKAGKPSSKIQQTQHTPHAQNSKTAQAHQRGQRWRHKGQSKGGTVEKGNGTKWPRRAVPVAQEQSRHQRKAPQLKQAQANAKASQIRAIQPVQAGWIIGSTWRQLEKGR